VAFGLLPLGSVAGRVFEDANRNGQLDAGEPPIADAVVVLDAGQRSELARKGHFRFDAVRAGDHRIELLKESLPEGAAIVGDVDRPVSVSRDSPHGEVLYLVTIEKRPEIRKVFPARGGLNAAASPSAGRGGGGAAAPITRSPARASAPAPRALSVPPPAAAGPYTIQIAALTDSASAAALKDDLLRGGFEAYVVEPGAPAPDGLYRVRVGKYGSRASAQRVMSRLEAQLGLTLWLTKER
jgi:cell division septation protein DedD